MRRAVCTALAAGAVILATAMPAEAQRYRWDFGINGGGSWYSDALDEEDVFVGVFDDFDDFDVDGKFKAGWLLGAQLTYWVPRIFGWEDRLGIRANLAYSERPFELDFNGTVFDGFVFDDEIEIDDVNLWSGTGDLLFRFRSPRRGDFSRVEWMPYLALGAGAKWIDPAFNITVGDEEGSIIDLGDRIFLIEDATKFMGLVGLGTDLRFSRRFALRAEVGDRIWDAPIRALGVDAINGDLFIIEDDDVGNVIHELYGQLGIHVLFGLARPKEVAVVAPPAPPPPPPAEEAITVCVIDPTIPGGISEIQALYVPARGDTLVTVNGQRVEIERAYERRVAVADQMDWYVRGEPLEITVNGETAEFVTYGGGRVIRPADIAFIGMINGTPVYADAAEARDIREEVEERRRARQSGDLEEILEERDDLREDFDDIEVLYVPLRPVGCVFQPVRRVEEVRKVRG